MTLSVGPSLPYRMTVERLQDWADTLGSIVTQSANAVAITGGTITGITDLAVADGGTAASSASSARTNLGLAIGTNVQAYDAELAAIAGLTSAADKGIYFTGSGTAAVFDLKSDARTFCGLTDITASATQEGVVEKATSAEVAAETADKYPDSSLLKYHPGVAKFSVSFDTTGAVAESYNVTSVTNDSTGLFTLNLAVTMANANYRVHVDLDQSAAQDRITHLVGRTTTTCQVAIIDSADTLTENSVDAIMVTGFGTLA